MAKFLAIALLCVLSAALVKSAINKEELLKEFMEFSEQCMNEKGATKADIEDIMNKQPAASKEAKCMRACIMKKYKVMDEAGKFDKSVSMEHAKFFTDGDAEKMKTATEIIDACAAISVPSDPCEAAEVLGKCFKDQAKAHGIEKMEF